MPKYSRKNRASKKRNRKTYKQKGGEFTDEERNELHNLGFTDEHIQVLVDNNLTNIHLARNSLQQINPDTGINFTPQEIIDSVVQINEDMPLDNSNDSLNESNISADSDDSEIHELNDDNLDLDFLGDDNIDNVDNADSMNTTNENISMIHDNDNDNNMDDNFEPLHLSDLDEVNYSNNTSMGDNSFGGKTKKRKTRKHRKGTKKNKKHRKTLKNIRNFKKGKRRKTMKKNKVRKMRGGNVDELNSPDFNANLAYDSKLIGGRNIGANCSDPNFSIYNTRELELFPYKPNN